MGKAAASPSALLLVLGLIGCSDTFDPPPDVETGTGADDVVEDVVVFDGEAHGNIFPPRLRDRGAWGTEAPDCLTLVGTEGMGNRDRCSSG